MGGMHMGGVHMGGVHMGGVSMGGMHMGGVPMGGMHMGGMPGVGMPGVGMRGVGMRGVGYGGVGPHRGGGQYGGIRPGSRSYESPRPGGAKIGGNRIGGSNVGGLGSLPHHDGAFGPSHPNFLSGMKTGGPGSGGLGRQGFPGTTARGFLGKSKGRGSAAGGFHPSGANSLGRETSRNHSLGQNQLGNFLSLPSDGGLHAVSAHRPSREHLGRDSHGLSRRPALGHAVSLEVACGRGTAGAAESGRRVAAQADCGGYDGESSGGVRGEGAGVNVKRVDTTL